jgi:hypothetical protein
VVDGDGRRQCARAGLRRNPDRRSARARSPGRRAEGISRAEAASPHRCRYGRRRSCGCAYRDGDASSW